ncbi:cyclopropane-fatty-acyl-phospholipid synthase [Mycobacterium sp. 852013-50091_SCH5140682]|uniref:SAM-dependent methyltransferase n=1 Tax=Mycobacterium sp. 852013-50091_SCH5140682 TaxID=1834109 RepID=UPI0007EBB5A6|nr:cyclopropane-fatty-acyl-phospholipid synthase family protein [Mycobacterium sp. 852013-50091_SCH5140682]OBC04194.1 cyclopropane-fatty-acyl-phospholipid synthase [Mycobacterium sp. 852013-50091_SCH5140682]
MTLETDITPAQQGPTRWRDIDRVPRGPRVRLGAPIAESLFRRATRDLPLRVDYSDTPLAESAADAASPRLVVHRPDHFFARLAAAGLIGFGESYMAGDWSSPDLAAVLTVLAAGIDTLVPAPLHRLRHLCLPRVPRSHYGTRADARANIAHHYDLSNEFFSLFLDESMTYSSALFADLGTAPIWPDIVDAQHRKIDRLLDVAGVTPGSRVLEIGTGWGELTIRAAQRGAQVHTITLSREQQLLARRRIAAAGLSSRATVELCDYRDVQGRYDAIVSVEMIEAVGHRYLTTYLRTLDRLLAENGRIALQAITMPDHRMRATRNTYTWVHKYIFPGGFLPSVDLLEQTVARRTSLRMVDRYSFGPHYAHTLRLWLQRFTAHAPGAEALGFDETFQRMWRFYLAYSQAGFASGYLDVHQFVLDRSWSSDHGATRR